MKFLPGFRLGLATAVVFALVTFSTVARAVQISVDVTKDRVPVSPYIYGRNGGLSHDSQQPLKESEWQFLRDSGVRMLRELGGNNGTKYNWQKKLTSHPDWYNNVYRNDWDFAQSSLQQHLPGVQSMWSFPLIGKVADNTAHNFDDWSYNQSQWWPGTSQNLAGGGTVNTSGGAKASKEGNPSLYLTDSSADTSTAILDHWIKPTGLGLDRDQFLYWNMDNEPEIWNGTHDDVMPTLLSAEAFMQRYFEYAKRARARFPEIKIVGPVPANEWQWFNWGNSLVTAADGNKYPWLEFFIKRISEEQALTGVRLLDVLDIHYYPGPSDPASVVQLHRTFFDPTYVNPDANAVHAVNGGWDTSITQEYIFGRCQQWLDKYLGAKHGVTLGLSETGIAITNAPVSSVWYASTLGEFMKHGVEIFTPWSWQPGMWEVLHLYSRYNYTTAVRAVSDDETHVSAYATSDDTTGNVTVVLVNRELTQTKSTVVSLAGATIPDGSYPTLQLGNLPGIETFRSHSDNALKSGTVTVASRQFSITLPPLSITSVLLHPMPDTTPAPPLSSASRVANISVRARGGVGSEVLILGFVISGSGSKQIVLRGVGPTLKDFGVTNAMTDPAISLRNGHGDAIFSNNNWGADAASADFPALFSKVGAFSLSSGSLDSAVAPVLPVGPYSALINPNDGTGGVALGEVYDADAASPARIVNISARTWVGTDANVLIAGFVIAGPADKRVLIRAVGPGLVNYGVTGVLANPVLRVFRAGVPIPLFQNDDWSSTSYTEEIAATATTIGAFSLATGSKDSALLLTLHPGTYSAVVAGSNDTTGVALIEVYEAD
jgi:hypothetical protein